MEPEPAIYTFDYDACTCILLETWLWMGKATGAADSSTATHVRNLKQKIYFLGHHFQEHTCPNANAMIWFKCSSDNTTNYPQNYCTNSRNLCNQQMWDLRTKKGSTRQPTQESSVAYLFLPLFLFLEKWSETTSPFHRLGGPLDSDGLLATFSSTKLTSSGPKEKPQIMIR